MRGAARHNARERKLLSDRAEHAGGPPHALYETQLPILSGNRNLHGRTHVRQTSSTTTRVVAASYPPPCHMATATIGAQPLIGSALFP